MLGWLGVAAVIVLSLRPHPPQLPGLFGWDKVQHLLAYAVLIWWFRQAFRGGIRWVLALVALGVGLEFLQALTPNRVFDYADMAANVLGVVLGLVVAATALGRTLAWGDALVQSIIDRRHHEDDKTR
ncbi:MAG: VanZ family protein [Dehalococcoidia bacterium]